MKFFSCVLVRIEMLGERRDRQEDEKSGSEEETLRNRNIM
jgi:hypothetical protein